VPWVPPWVGAWVAWVPWVPHSPLHHCQSPYAWVLRSALRQCNNAERGTLVLNEIAGELFILEPDRLELLEHAIRHHTGGRTSDDPTVGTCWDADRLDIGRVGIIPHERYMSTERARRLLSGAVHL